MNEPTDLTVNFEKHFEAYVDLHIQTLDSIAQMADSIEIWTRKLEADPSDPGGNYKQSIAQYQEVISAFDPMIRITAESIKLHSGKDPFKLEIAELRGLQPKEEYIGKLAIDVLKSTTVDLYK